jgi:hypothetical protein
LPANSLAIISACFNTVSVASNFISGGYQGFIDHLPDGRFYLLVGFAGTGAIKFREPCFDRLKKCYLTCA